MYAGNLDGNPPNRVVDRTGRRSANDNADTGGKDDEPMHSTDGRDNTTPFAHGGGNVTTGAGNDPTSNTHEGGRVVGPVITNRHGNAIGSGTDTDDRHGSPDRGVAPGGHVSTAPSGRAGRWPAWRRPAGVLAGSSDAVDMNGSLARSMEEGAHLTTDMQDAAG